MIPESWCYYSWLTSRVGQFVQAWLHIIKWISYLPPFVHTVMHFLEEVPFPAAFGVPYCCGICRLCDEEVRSTLIYPGRTKMAIRSHVVVSLKTTSKTKIKICCIHFRVYAVRIPSSSRKTQIYINIYTYKTWILSVCLSVYPRFPQPPNVPLSWNLRSWHLLAQLKTWRSQYGPVLTINPNLSNLRA